MTAQACGARPGAKQIAPGVDSNSLAFFLILSMIPWGTGSPVSWTSLESGWLIAPSRTSKSGGDLVRSVSATLQVGSSLLLGHLTKQFELWDLKVQKLSL